MQFALTVPFGHWARADDGDALKSRQARGHTAQTEKGLLQDRGSLEERNEETIESR